MEVRGRQPGQQPTPRRLAEARLEALLASRKHVHDAMEAVSNFAVEHHEAAQGEEAVQVEISDAARSRAIEQRDAGQEERVQELKREFEHGELFSRARLEQTAERMLGE